ncbi:YbhB/YbcL family Raf kinase inhibitor-like protein [Ectothiorhodospiraceae bacterium 2226]|nr:YbhB/YbcL family Raf kinase inhibitor-like protein [Ectothiorhodospiraceae bacterium 2226]
MALTLTSPSFGAHEPIPAPYTCDGDERSPPLAWHGLPADTQSLALVVYDPDAPDPRNPQTTWVHWVLYNLPPDTDALPEGVTTEVLPAGTREGLNGWQRTGYGGPCPPIGRHRYFHKLYALDSVLPDLGVPNMRKLEDALRDHVLAEAELVGTYERSRRRR